MKSRGPSSRLYGEEDIEFFDDTTDMSIILEPATTPTNYNAVIVSYPLNGTQMIVTGRDIDEYLPFVQDSPFLPTQQFVEVGPGCAELVPRMIQNMGSKLKHKPIIIDPVDYGLVRDHLQGLLDQFPNHPAVLRLQERIQEFILRCSILLGDDIIHIKAKLSDALRLHGDLLIGKADCVVSIHGPITHCDSEFPEVDTFKLLTFLHEREKVRAMHRQLLKKPDGRLICNI